MVAKHSQSLALHVFLVLALSILAACGGTTSPTATRGSSEAASPAAPTQPVTAEPTQPVTAEVTPTIDPGIPVAAQECGREDSSGNEPSFDLDDVEIEGNQYIVTGTYTNHLDQDFRLRIGGASPLARSPRSICKL